MNITSPSRFRLKNLFIISIVICALAITALFFYIHSLSNIIEAKFEGPKWNVASKVYSDSFQIYPGLNVKKIALKDKLKRLGYRQVQNPTDTPGQFFIQTLSDTQQVWAINLKDFDYPLKSFVGFQIQLELESDVIEKITKKDKTELFLIKLEPEQIAEFFEGIRADRKLVKLEQVPTSLLNAIISVEDTRFLEHSGVDPKGIMRAFISNLKSRSRGQGGSTITQQLVKNFFLTHKKSYIRKINEALMALIVEGSYSKDEILETYLNEIYMGQRGSSSMHGVATAAEFYFAKSLKQLSLSECAMLAGLIQNPWLHSPFRNIQRAKKRRDVVLQKMLRAQTILESEYQAALTQPIAVPGKRLGSNFAPYFVDLVRKELLENYSKEILTTKGLKIFTTLDVDFQIYANEAVTETLNQLESYYADLKTNLKDGFALQSSLVVLQPQTGFIRAIVGGRNFDQTQFNRAIQAKRQPGSLFKPIVLLAALENFPNKYNLTTKFSDAPFTYKYADKVWEPKNYDEEPKGNVTLRQTIEESINIPTARLATEVGINKIAQLAEKMGIESNIRSVPSLALGSAEVTPLEMASVYSVFANGGIKAKPISIRHVIAPNGKSLQQRSLDIKRVASEEGVFLVTQTLKGVIERGTGQGIKKFGFLHPAAGKTGTTNKAMDAWFAGFTPELVAVAWTGYDKDKPIGLTGAYAALPIWARFMVQASQRIPMSDFFMPEKIITKTIDPLTGELYTKKCPNKTEEFFIKNTEPKIACQLHSPQKRKMKK